MRTQALILLASVLALGTGCGSEKGSAGSVDANSHVAAGAAGAAGAAAQIAGAAGAGAEVGLGLFGVWREVQEVARSSPDHLTAAADRVVASKDPQAILTFVANFITTIPARSNGFGEAGGARRFGTRAVLRGATGTMRDKAELLAELYTRAGFEAQIMLASVDDSEATARKALLGNPARPGFAPTMDDARVARWRQVTGTRAVPAASSSLDAKLPELKALAKRISDAIPAAAASPDRFDWSSLIRVPVVSVKVNGVDTIANPNVRDSVLGQNPAKYPPEPAWAATPLPKIQAELSVATALSPTKRVVVAKQEYALDDLCGRQLVIKFNPAEPLATALSRKVGDIEAFVPMMGVRGRDLSGDELARLSVAGSAVTVGGNVVTSTATGLVEVDGVPLGPHADDPQAVNRVASVVIDSVDAALFPRVVLHARALDAGGIPVAGLPASALVVTDASQIRPALVRSNAPSPPRVLFLLDTSASLPPEFLGEQAATVVHDMAAGVAAIDPASQFAVGAVYEGLSGLSDWMSDLDALRTTAASALGYQSALWLSLAQAALTDSTVIVFITDGVTEDPPTDLDLQRVSNGPPVVTLGVGEVDQATLRRMAELSGGTSSAVTQAAEAVNSVATFLRARQAAPLVIQYTASTEGPMDRPVTMQAGKAPISAPLSYKVPDPSQRSVPDGVAGVYLTLEYDNQEVTRTLAGGEFDDRSAISQAMLDEVRLAMMGEYAVSIEAGAPTTAQWFDDMAAAKLALEPLWTAAHQGVNGTKFAEALATLQPTIPRSLPVLHTALPAASNGLVYETGLRAVLLASYPVPGKGVRTRADILPFTRFATAAVDDSAFASTLESSLLLALAEKSVYTLSTIALLEGKPLLGLRDYPDLEVAMPTVAPERRAALKRALAPYENNINVVAQDASVLAFFTIDRRTGSALAIMPDGSGGGLSGDDKRAYDNAMSLANWLSVAGEFGGMGFAFGGVVALSKAILRVITAEALMVAAIGTDEDPGNPFTDGGCKLACDLAKSTVSEIFGLGALSKADALADALGPGGYSCGCGSGP